MIGARARDLLHVQTSINTSKIACRERGRKGARTTFFFPFFSTTAHSSCVLLPRWSSHSSLMASAIFWASPLVCSSSNTILLSSVPGGHVSRYFATYRSTIPLARDPRSGFPFKHNTHLARRLARDAGGGGGGGDELLHLQPLLEVVLSFAHGFCVCLLLASWLPLLWPDVLLARRVMVSPPSQTTKKIWGRASSGRAPLSVSPQNLIHAAAFTGRMYTEGNQVA